MTAATDRRRVLVLSDSINPWHSLWIRFGQYIPDLVAAVDLCDQVLCTASGLLGWREGQATPAADVLLLYRFADPDPAFLAALQRERQRGVHLIADIDDYLWWGGGWDPARLRSFTRALRLCHTLTCSTVALAEWLRSLFPAQQVVLIANSTPAEQAAPAAHTATGSLRLGWTGAPWTRPDDLALLRPLARWSLEHPAIHWVHVGAVPGRLPFAEAVGLPAERVSCRPLVPYNRYLQAIDFDVGLAPLAPTVFNHFKSDLKVLEYSSLAIPWLASDVEPYQQLCSQWTWPGRLCRSGDDWVRLLQPLLDDAQRRQEGESLQGLARSARPRRRTVAAWQQLIDAPPRLTQTTTPASRN